MAAYKSLMQTRHHQVLTLETPSDRAQQMAHLLRTQNHFRAIHEPGSHQLRMLRDPAGVAPCSTGETTWSWTRKQTSRNTDLPGIGSDIHKSGYREPMATGFQIRTQFAVKQLAVKILRIAFVRQDASLQVDSTASQGTSKPGKSYRPPLLETGRKEHLRPRMAVAARAWPSLP